MKSLILIVAFVLAIIILLAVISSPRPGRQQTSTSLVASTSSTTTTTVQDQEGSTITSTESALDNASASSDLSSQTNPISTDTSMTTSNGSLDSSTDQNSTSETVKQPGNGLLSIQLTDPPNVPANVTDVYINYSAVQVGIPASDNSSISWYNATLPGEINLMKMVNISITIGGNQVASGTFSQISFNISSAIITYNGLNYSATVQNNFINSSIINGGIYVPQSGSAGVLVDLSPTVTAYQNDSGSFFLLDPSAIGIPVPASYWNPNLEKIGAMANLSAASWWQVSSDQIMGNITIQYAILSNFTLQVFVQNIGANNVTINQISILENVSQSSGNTTTNSTQTVNSTSTVTNETQNQNLQYSLQAVGEFLVLSNGSLIPPSLAGMLNSSGVNVSVGLVASPNQTMTLNFQGNVTQDQFGNNLSQITVGQTFEIAVLGDFGTSVYLVSVLPITSQQD
jgi:hypothetical protein